MRAGAFFSDTVKHQIQWNQNDPYFEVRYLVLSTERNKRDVPPWLEIQSLVCDKEVYYMEVRLTVGSEISGSHGGEYEDGRLLGCCAV
jgi:hypothetical protein